MLRNILCSFARQTRRIVKYSSERSPLVYNCRGWTQNKFIRSCLKLLVTPFTALKYFRFRNITGREGLALVLIAKNEAPYIEEWINFHRRQGVSHFIIYDNESTDNFREVLKPFADSGLVTYSIINGRARQLDAYNKALHDYGHKFRYMGFIDADEFVFVRRTTDGGGKGIYAYFWMTS